LIGNLKLEAPHIWKLIRNELIGNNGVPGENGEALGGIVHEAEVKYNAEPGEYWYRFLRPDDPMFTGGTKQVFAYAMVATTVNDIFAGGQPVVVQTAEAIISFGWYLDSDLDQKGYLLIQKETVDKILTPARIVWRQQNPDHYYIDLNNIIKAFETARVHYKIYNGFAWNVTAIALPLLFRIASKPVLNLERRVKK